MKFKRLSVALSVFVAVGIFASTASALVIRVASTTDVNDSGQWANVMGGPYEKAHPGTTFKTEFVGTGKAIENAEEGRADVLITHAPSLEEGFVAAGYSNESNGRALFYNDYVIVGPKTDPAKVEETEHHDAVRAFEQIALSTATNANIRFESRGENSGTNVQEQILWGLTPTVEKQHACNSGTSTTRFEPGHTVGGVCMYPTWYVKTLLGQGANLEATSKCTEEMEKLSPKGGCYTMLDRGTWLANAGKFTNLKIVSAENSESAIGGKTLQTNYFHAYVLNPAKTYPREGTEGKPNAVAAQEFVNFLISPKTQEKLSSWPNESNPAGTGDAVALATYSAPASTPKGSEITIKATLHYGAPPQLVLPNYPGVQLQMKEEGKASYENVGAPQTANASGEVTFTGVKLGTANTRFRLSVPEFGVPAPNIITLFTAGVTLQTALVKVT